MKTTVYVVAVSRSDDKFPGAEKIMEQRFFSELQHAQQCRDYYNNTIGGHYAVYQATIEITEQMPS
jgi:hypothetical protein